MEIVFIASNYRTEKSQVHVFLDNVVRILADRGVKCNVIAPQSWISCLRRPEKARELVSVRKTEQGNEYTVYSPRFTLYPPKRVGGVSLADFSKRSFYKAASRIYKKFGLNADVVYAHFLQAGSSAVMLADEIGVPCFIANGEADTIGETANLSRALVKRTLNRVAGIISVSTANKNEILELSGDESILEKTRVLVNAVDAERFHKKDKASCREKLGFPKDAFIVGYTGSFIHRKGTRRLSNALSRFDDVYSVFIGVGDEGPTCDRVLYQGRVNNAEIGDYLNAVDVFALPTLAEGCCNAIVEAIACGVPVVSSDRPFNYDVLDESNSILIDPLDENAIYEAIKRLKEDSALRERLAAGALEKAKGLSLTARVDKIQSFIEETRATFSGSKR